MSRIRSKDTKPEMTVRKLLHAMGYRFRLHRTDLPGTPDIVLPRYRKVIFVHGCYWHTHNCKYGRVVPRTNQQFWAAKRAATVARDRRKRSALRRLGWDVLTVWECQLKDEARLRSRLGYFLKARTTFKQAPKTKGKQAKTVAVELEDDAQAL